MTSNDGRILNDFFGGNTGNTRSEAVTEVPSNEMGTEEPTEYEKVNEALTQYIPPNAAGGVTSATTLRPSEIASEMGSLNDTMMSFAPTLETKVSELEGVTTEEVGTLTQPKAPSISPPVSNLSSPTPAPVTVGGGKMPTMYPVVSESFPEKYFNTQQPTETLNNVAAGTQTNAATSNKSRGGTFPLAWISYALLAMLISWLMYRCCRWVKRRRDRRVMLQQADTVLGDMQMVPNDDFDHPDVDNELL